MLQAIEQGKKILPQILKSKNGGIDVLQQAGVPKGFIDDMYSRYGRHSGKLGIDPKALESEYKRVSRQMGGQTGYKFDRSRYPRV